MPSYTTKISGDRFNRRLEILADGKPWGETFPGEDHFYLAVVEAEAVLGNILLLEHFGGVWHTHPDHPPRPSSTDLAAAWEGYTYVILSVGREGVADTRAWRLAGSEFVEQSIEEMTP